jgi:multisubunit Na+/H+ antiporter MnhE subunit
VTNKPRKSIVRPPKRHRGDAVGADNVDVRQLVKAQSFRDAVVAGAIVVILFSLLWAMLSTLLGRIFPWMTMVLGVLVGLVIRRAGRGLDWRFPALAAAITLAGALISNVVVAAAFTAEALGASTFEILRAVTAMTWPVFFDEVVSAADIIFGLFAAAVAAFYANRQLSRGEYSALRKWREARRSELEEQLRP